MKAIAYILKIYCIIGFSWSERAKRTFQSGGNGDYLFNDCGTTLPLLVAQAGYVQTASVRIIDFLKVNSVFQMLQWLNLWWQHGKSKKFKYELNLNHYQNRWYATVFFDKIHFFQLNCKQRIVYPNNPGYWLPDRLLVRWIILDWHQFQPGQVWAIRSSHQGSSVKKAVLKSFAKCFPAKFAKYLRTRILKKICEWLLLSLFLFWWKRKYSKRLDVCCYRS